MSIRPDASDSPVGAQTVVDAVRGWQRDLADVGGPNTLLWYRDLPLGTLDLSTAHPGGVAMLMAGRATRLSDLVREPTAFAEALRRAHVIHAKTRELREERGLAVGFMAIGMATWTIPPAGTLPDRRAAGGRPSVGQRPYAPVLLRSCQLRPLGPAAPDYDLDLGVSVEVNPVLLHYLIHELGLDVDSEALVDLARAARRFDPVPVFRELNRICREVPGFHVTDRKVLATFPYAKLPAVLDVAAIGSGGQAPALVTAVVEASCRARRDEADHAGVVSPDPATVDEAGENLVLPADATQVAAVSHVTGGGHLVIQAPPGTGEARTIANVVAALAARGESVLFVAEKRAVIDRVNADLAGVGLDHLVLDVGAVPGPADSLLHQLLARIEAAGEQPPHEHDTDELRERLRAHRGRLADHHAAMHRPRSPWQVSLADAHGALASLARGAPPTKAPICRVRLKGPVLAALSRQDATRCGRLLAETVGEGAWSGPVADDPWFGARIETPQDADHAATRVNRLAGGGFQEAAARLDSTLTGAGLSPAGTPRDWSIALELLHGLAGTLTDVDDAVLIVPLQPLLAATGDRDYRRESRLTHGQRQHWWTRWSLRRQARALVRPGREVPDLHRALSVAQTQRDAWAGLTSAPCPTDPVPSLEEARSVWLSLSEDLNWLGTRWSDTAAGGDLEATPVPAVQDRLTRARETLDRMRVLPVVTARLDELRAAGLGDVVADLAARAVPADRIPGEVDFVWWTSVLEEVADQDPDYGQHDGVALRSVSAEYVRLDEAFARAAADNLDASRLRLLRRALADHPEQARHLNDVAVRGSGRGRGGLEATAAAGAVHDLLTGATEVVRAAAPCWAMSPVAVASVVPAGVRFDVVILAEAGRIPIAHAMSALSRAGRVVVVGDSRQLPPVPYRTAATEADTSPAGDDLVATRSVDSVLDVIADVAPTCTLTWHDESADERLVQFANAHSYGGMLMTLPAAAALSPVRLVRVGAEGPTAKPAAEAPPAAEPPVHGQDVEHDEVGTGHRQPEATTPAIGSQHSDREVARVVRLAIDHAVRRPTESLGVVTLSRHHAARIAQAIRAALATYPDPAVVAYFAAERPGLAREPFFVTSVEGAQGDYRDAIILALGLEPTAQGLVPDRLGPLSAPGGHRRLTVATTRARQRMVVVSAFDAADVDPRRLAGRGAQLLGGFLAIAGADNEVAGAVVAGGPARQGHLAADGAGDPGEAGGSADPLMGELASRLRHEGLVVREGFGSGRLPIGLVIDDPYAPGRPIVAVESDGAEYAALTAVRDRERLRPEQLRRLGWETVRVWGTDVFRDPARDVARVVEAVRASDARSGWSTSNRGHDAGR
ncbi:MAG TPA: AAA domain-containing protein [Dermatophilaceae bacterium]|nr:AAA domain-containing protein [Dermatophilaceae bacterium]